MTRRVGHIPSAELQADLELARAVVARDRKAGAEFVQRYTDVVYAYVRRRITRRVDVVDDVVQDVILAAWKSLGRYEGDAPLAHWIMGIARFKINDYYRAQLRATLSLDDEDVSREPADSRERFDVIFEKSEAAEKAAVILSEMREEYGLLLRWKYWDGKSAREMAEELTKTEKSVERMLARARDDFEQRWLGIGGGIDVR